MRHSTEHACVWRVASLYGCWCECIRDWLPSNCRHNDLHWWSMLHLCVSSRSRVQHASNTTFVVPVIVMSACRDVGVYVAITSLEPLLAYVFTGGVLLRFCSKDYVRDITPDTHPSSYVVSGLDDYTPATRGEGRFVHCRMLHFCLRRHLGLCVCRVSHKSPAACASQHAPPPCTPQTWLSPRQRHPSPESQRMPLCDKACRAANIHLMLFPAVTLLCSGSHEATFCRRGC